MEDPLLSRSDGDSSSNEEHIVDIIADEQTPNEAEGVQRCGPITYEYVRSFFDLALTLVQIVTAIVVMVQAKDKHPQVWIIGYTCGCIAILPCLCWRFWQYSPCFSSDSYPTRINEVMDFWKKVIECFFVGWVVLLVLYLTDNLSSLDNTTQHFWLCMAFLAFSIIRYVIPNFKWAACGFCFLSKVVGDTIMEVLGLILKVIFTVFYMSCCM